MLLVNLILNPGGNREGDHDGLVSDINDDDNTDVLDVLVLGHAILHEDEYF